MRHHLLLIEKLEQEKTKSVEMKSKKKMKGVDLNDYGDAGSGKLTETKKRELINKEGNIV